MNKTAIDAMMDRVEWVTVAPNGKNTIEADLPCVTHTGILRIGDIEITVMQLDDGRRIIPEDEVIRLFDCLGLT